MAGHFNKCSGAPKPNMFQNRPCIFQQDCAPARIRLKLRNSVLKIMYLNLLVVIIGHQPTQTLIHLTTNCGQFCVCTRLHHNLESLKQALVEAVDNFPMDIILTVIDEWPNRLLHHIQANGGHFE